MASTKSSGGQSKRGFASMDEDKQREIASKGGKAAHEKGTAHEFTSAEAREAGRKGGEASHGRSGGSASSGGSSAHAKSGSQSHK
jgi:general stress protein YciG